MAEEIPEGNKGNGEAAGGGRSLADVPLFSGLRKKELGRIEAACQWRDVETGEKIIGRGETDREVYFLLAGIAHVLNFADSGRAVDYAALESGDYFGELAAIDGEPRSATVITRTPCRLAVMTGDAFLKLITSNKKIAMAVFKKLARIVRLGDDRIIDLSLLGAEQRVCLELLRLARPDPIVVDNLEIFPVPTQELIANSVGVARETVARIFGQLSSDGVIERKAKVLYIRDRNRLEELALAEGRMV